MSSKSRSRWLCAEIVPIVLKQAQSSKAENGEEPTVATRRQPTNRRAIVQLGGLWLPAALLAGCGGSPELKAIPEPASKVLIQRKVDVGQRAAKPASARPRSLKRQAPPR
jgi:hypothetical protein